MFVRQQSCKKGTIQVIQVVVLIKLAKYLSQELLAPNQCFKGSWRLGSGSLKEEIWFFTWVIKCVVIEDSSAVKKALFSLNYGTDASWDAVRILRTTQFCNMTFLIVENSEFSRLIACLITIIYSLLHEFVEALIWPVISLKWSYQRRQWHPTPVLLPGKSHGRRSLEGCSPWGRWGSDTTERLHLHFSLSCIGEGNGNPLQCSCLESPRDGEAWWAAVYGVVQSRTWLKRLRSSSSSKWSYHWITDHLSH